jgi:hypothetical protein
MAAARHAFEWCGLQAIACWKGPYHEVFDYSLNNMSIEVKTTAGKMPYKAYISNEMQLNDRLAGGTLALCFIAVQLMILPEKLWGIL